MPLRGNKARYKLSRLALMSVEMPHVLESSFATLANRAAAGNSRKLLSTQPGLGHRT